MRTGQGEREEPKATPSLRLDLPMAVPYLTLSIDSQ